MASGGVTDWSIRHPVSIIMLSLTVVVLGVFGLGKLSIDLLPQRIYPEIRVRVLDPGVPATVMESTVTRPLEVRLALTEDVTGVESRTTEGVSEIDLHFPYGKIIDVALRDARARLDRARRDLPVTIDPPMIDKLDPAQVPVMEFVLSSALRSPRDLRSWVDDVFSKQFLNLAGVAEIGIAGGVEREIQVLPQQRRLAGLGLSLDDIINAIREGNEDIPAGHLRVGGQQYAGSTAGGLNSLGAIDSLPIRLPGRHGDSIPLSELARVVDSHEDQRIRVRFNGVPGVRLWIRKQPTANTVDVADQVHARLAWMRANGLIPDDIAVRRVSDASVYVRRSLSHAAIATVVGAVLALVVVYLFLGRLRATLIIGTTIPISIMATFLAMAVGGLNLNIMTLGGLALGVGMLIDNAIVVLENIRRHGRDSPQHPATGIASGATREVRGSIITATSTRLAAMLPFLFIGGLAGQLFRELIFTLSAALVVSLVVALTLVPAVAARTLGGGTGRYIARVTDFTLERVQNFYSRQLERVLHAPLRWLLLAAVVLALTAPVFLSRRQEFLPPMDDGLISIHIRAKPGISLDAMDAGATRVEKLARSVGEVKSVYTVIGNHLSGRTERETPNRSRVLVQLLPVQRRKWTSAQWVNRFYQLLARAHLAGMRIYAHPRGVRGLRTGSDDDDIDIRVQGRDLQTLSHIGAAVVQRLRGVPGLRDLVNSAAETQQQFAIQIDRTRAADLGVNVADIGRALRIALNGIVASDFIDGDRSYHIRVRLPAHDVAGPRSLGGLLLIGQRGRHRAVYLRDVASVHLAPVPAEILHDNQQRIVDVSASLTGERALGAVLADVHRRLDDLPLPVGYYLYYAGTDEALVQGRRLSGVLAGLALFLVFVAMAVQYESMRIPAVILVCVPFMLIGVAVPFLLGHLPFLAPVPLSMPVWFGLVMLVGIVVNNAIILVEFTEISRRQGRAVRDAIREAARLRLRPALLITLTAVLGMMPLALGLGSGSEILQPLAMVMVYGLSFSAVATLLLVPAVYLLIVGRGEREHRTG